MASLHKVTDFGENREMGLGLVFPLVYLLVGVTRPSHDAVATYWAPVIYQDLSSPPAGSPFGFVPTDHWLDFFFDGNQDLRDNAINAFHLEANQISALLRSATLYYSVIESKDYFYINYIVYHSMDNNAAPHAHDDENLFLIIEKSGSYGDLVAAISNAHGYGMAYSPNSELQSSFRNKLGSDKARGILRYLDQNGTDHDSLGRVEFLNSNRSRSIKIFSTQRSHSLYKFSSPAYLAGNHNRGVFYRPADCRACQSDPLVRNVGSIPYQLVDIDQLLLDNRSGKNKAILLSESKQDLVAGRGEIKTEANLFFTVDFHTEFPLSDPAKFFHSLNLKEEIEPVYLTNPYLGGW